MARPISRSARSSLSERLVLWLMSYREALDWVSETSSVFHLRVVNAALDSREGLLTWLEGRSVSPRLISASPVFGRQIEMRLVSNGSAAAPLDAASTVENLGDFAQPRTIALESAIPEAPSVEAAEVTAFDQGSSQTVSRTYESEDLCLAEVPAADAVPLAPSPEMTAPCLPALRECTPPPPPLPAQAAYAQEHDRVTDRERPRPKRVRAALSPDRTTRRVWTFIRAAQTNRTALSRRS